MNLIVKIGGSILGAHDTTLQDLVTLQRQGTVPVVVHGGGAAVTKWLELHGIGAEFVRGLRVTEAGGLEVVIAVLAGLVNKQLVAAIHALGGRAAGISGVDGGTVEGRVYDPDLGYVGEVSRIDLGLLEALMAAGYMPVVAPLGFNAPAAESLAASERGVDGRDAQGRPLSLNFNADTIAGEIAAAMAAEKLVFLTDVPGVQGRRREVLAHLSRQEAEGLIQDGVASGGMLPKLEACLRARARGSECWIVDGRVAHMLLTVLGPTPSGTRVW